MSEILSFQDVELYYDHVYALKGVSINVQLGETVALIGANGAGKSSILRAITGLRKIKSGSISYMGERLDGASASDIVRKGIAMVPEGRRVTKLMAPAWVLRPNNVPWGPRKTSRRSMSTRSDKMPWFFPTNTPST